MIDFKEKIDFDWDEGNIDKNQIKHNVHFKECEEVFLNKPMIDKDIKHSLKEKRYFCLGETNKKRYLFISFTIRNYKIRVISARPMSKKERRIYEKIKKNS
ncbi:MAG: BrnT family toxin [Candidatus Microgenomates bacterium]